MRDDAVLRRALPLGRGLGRSVREMDVKIKMFYEDGWERAVSKTRSSSRHTQVAIGPMISVDCRHICSTFQWGTEEPCRASRQTLKVGFHYPSSRPESTLLTARELGCIFWHPSTRAKWTRVVKTDLNTHNLYVIMRFSTGSQCSLFSSGVTPSSQHAHNTWNRVKTQLHFLTQSALFTYEQRLEDIHSGHNPPRVRTPCLFWDIKLDIVRTLCQATP